MPSDDYWGDLTVADLEDMGLTLEDLDAIMAEQGGGGMDYGQYGVLDPIDISPQATQWDILDAQKTSRAAMAPPSPTERRLTRNFIFPKPDEFSYDAALQSNPYIRQLLVDAVAGAGPDNPYGANAWLAGEDQEDDWEKAVEGALPDFERIADDIMFDDKRWATEDEDERRELMRSYLQREGENWLAGAAPSASRNTNWADWAENRRPGSGEQFPAYEGAGFDGGGGQPQQQAGPQVQVDPARFARGSSRDAEAQMSMSDFRKTYHDLLRSDALVEVGDRYEDPDSGGYWVVEKNKPGQTAVQRQRRRNATSERRERLRERNRSPRPSLLSQLKTRWQRALPDWSPGRYL